MKNNRISIFVGIGAGVILGLMFLFAGFFKLPVQTDAYTILLLLSHCRKG